MSVSHDAERRETWAAPRVLEQRLPTRQSVAVIASLSVLSWVAVVGVIRALVATL
jgi:hypothetical protein